jgi:uncharacterized protein YbjT (DUF2867 family)
MWRVLCRRRAGTTPAGRRQEDHVTTTAVIGSSGQLGRRVVRQLVERGHDVIATSRTAPETPVDGARTALLDVRDPETIRSALAGATSVVIASHGLNPPGWRNGPRHVDDAGVGAIASALAGTDTHVVYLSLIGAAPDHELDFWRAKHAGERHLAAASIPTAVLRASAFMEFHAIEMLGAPLAKGKKSMIIGRGDRVRNLVSAEDVAELVVWAVESRYEGTLDVVGPHDASPGDDVETIAAVLGTEPKAMRIDPRVAKVLAVVPGRLVPNVGRIIDISLFTDAADRPAEPTELPAGAPVPHRGLAEVARTELIDGPRPGS